MIFYARIYIINYIKVTHQYSLIIARIQSINKETPISTKMRFHNLQYLFEGCWPFCATTTVALKIKYKIINL